ncbi:MAG: hypothetical protein ACRC0X_04825 [Brevinema sp.]
MIKKLLLSVLLFLGTCSTTTDTPQQQLADLLGGKNFKIEGVIANLTGVFNQDATTMTLTFDDKNRIFQRDNTSAIYKGKDFEDKDITITLTQVTKNGGKIQFSGENSSLNNKVGTFTVTTNDGSDNGNGGNNSGLPESGDPVLDEGLHDALQQIGSTVGLSRWFIPINEDDHGSYKDKFTAYWFLGNDTYKMISMFSRDGIYDSTRFNNEIITKSALGGDSSIISSGFTIKNHDGKDITADLSTIGYTEIRVFIPKKHTLWSSEKITGTGSWENYEGSKDTFYQLTKESSTELHYITIQLVEGSEYKTVHQSLEDALKYAIIYQKR